MISRNINHKAASRFFDDYAIAYDFQQKQYLLFNSVAGDIWYILSDMKTHTTCDIVERLLHIYDIDSNLLRKDVDDFLNHLERKELIKIKQKNIISETAMQPPPFQDIESVIVDKYRKNNALFSFTFELTYKCNEHCVHCYANYHHGTSKCQYLNLKICANLIHQLKSMGCAHLIFTGGDPFMFAGFVELLNIATQDDFSFDIYTNGQFLATHEELAAVIHDLNIKSYYISLYGPDSKTHDSITQVSGSFGKTIKTIKKLKELGDLVVVNIMVLSLNVSKIEETVELVRRLGVSYRIGFSIIAKNDGDASPDQYFVRNEVAITNLYKKTKEQIMAMGDAISTVENQLDWQEDYMCGAGISSMSIAPNGIVYPCISLKRPLGSIISESIQRIWNGEERMKLRNQLKMINFKECISCGFFKYCPHCPGISMQEKADMFSCNSCDSFLGKIFSQAEKETLS